MNKKILLGVGIVFFVLVILGAVIATIYISQKGVPAVNVDTASVPKFITASHVDLSNIGFISKFRSNSGHDFSDSTSPCSSMKHYFDYPDSQRQQLRGKEYIPPAPTAQNGVPVYSPVDGVITSIQTEFFPLGKQVYIQVNDAQQFTVRLFHVYPLDNIQEGTKVTSGMQIGLINQGQTTDIAIEANSLSGRRFYSIFEFMSDSLWSQYQALGLTNKEQFILSEDYRKQNPLKCEGEQFAQSMDQQNARTEWVQIK